MPQAVTLAGPIVSGKARLLSAAALVRRLLGGFVALALLTSLFAAVATSPANAGAGYQKPHKGECRNITWSQSSKFSNNSTPVSCALTHTYQTIATPKLSKRVWKTKKTATAAMNDKCHKAAIEALGRPYKKELMSAYAFNAFGPTKAQRAHGARWFRCDLTLFGGKKKLAPLTVTNAPYLTLPIPDNQAKCLTTNFYIITCALPHFLRVTGVVKLKGKAYPGKAKVKKMAVAKCRSRVTTNSFYYDWPTKAEWQSHYKWVLCESIDNTPRLAAPGGPGGVGRQVGVLADPGVHGDGSRSRGIDGAR